MFKQDGSASVFKIYEKGDTKNKQPNWTRVYGIHGSSVGHATPLRKPRFLPHSKHTPTFSQRPTNWCCSGQHPLFVL